MHVSLQAIVGSERQGSYLPLIRFMAATKRSLLSLLTGVLILCLSPSSIAGIDPISNIDEIRSLDPELAEQGLPVETEGQILWRDPFGRSFFMHREGKGIFVHQPGGALEHGWFRPGMQVRVSGTTRQGTYTPTILYDRIVPLGIAPLPKPRAFLAFETYSTSIDCDWVSLRGRILSMQIYGERKKGPRAVIEVESRDVTQNVLIPFTENTEEKIRKLMFHRVRFNAVVTTQSNTTRQAVGRAFFVNSADDFSVIDEPESLDEPPLLNISELMAAGNDPRDPVRIRGRVTLVDGKNIYLRGDKACVRAMTNEQANVRAGDYVELEGVVLPDPISPAFLARTAQLIEHGDPPEPMMMDLNPTLWAHWVASPDSRLNQELVQVEARLVDIEESYLPTSGEKEQRLLCRQEGRVFTVKLPTAAGRVDLSPGSMLRITGICNLTRSKKPDWRLQVDGFWIQTRNTAAIHVLSPAPWWNATRLFWILGLLFALIVLVSSWAILLRRTVRKQTKLIAKQVEQASVLNERQRIAGELHDTLQQGLTAMKMQLKLIHRGVEADLPGELPAVISAESMLEACKRETRASIQDLRGGLLEEMDLPSAIRKTIEERIKGPSIDFQMKLEGRVRRLTKFAEHQILRLVTEAAGNAIQHAAPTRLGIHMHYGQDHLKVEIRDDGRGFDPKAAKASGRFGLLGMHERANRLESELQIESEIGKGSAVRVTIPANHFKEGDRL